MVKRIVLLLLIPLSMYSQQYKEEQEVEDCRGNISSEDIPSADKGLLKFKITDSSQDKEADTTLTIDTKSISFIKGK